MDDKLANAIGRVLLEAVMGFTKLTVRISGKQPSLVMMMADRTKLFEDFREHTGKDPEGHDHGPGIMKQIEKDFGVSVKDLPYPVLAPLPPKTKLWGDFLTMALTDSQSVMYAVVTEAFGVKSEVYQDAEREFTNVHPDNLMNYALIQMGCKGQHSQAYAAPIQLNITSRDGSLSRKVGKFKSFNWIDTNLPTDW